MSAMCSYHKTDQLAAYRSMGYLVSGIQIAGADSSYWAWFPPENVVGEANDDSGLNSHCQKCAVIDAVENAAGNTGPNKNEHAPELKRVRDDLGNKIMTGYKVMLVAYGGKVPRRLVGESGEVVSFTPKGNAIVDFTVDFGGREVSCDSATLRVTEEVLDDEDGN